MKKDTVIENTWFKHVFENVKEDEHEYECKLFMGINAKSPINSCALITCVFTIFFWKILKIIHDMHNEYRAENWLWKRYYMSINNILLNEFTRYC